MSSRQADMNDLSTFLNGLKTTSEAAHNLASALFELQPSAAFKQTYRDTFLLDNSHASMRMDNPERLGYLHNQCRAGFGDPAGVQGGEHQKTLALARALIVPAIVNVRREAYSAANAASGGTTAGTVRRDTAASSSSALSVLTRPSHGPGSSSLNAEQLGMLEYRLRMEALRLRHLAVTHLFTDVGGASGQGGSAGQSLLRSLYDAPEVTLQAYKRAEEDSLGSEWYERGGSLKDLVKALERALTSEAEAVRFIRASKTISLE